jgi:hypothetical protein
MKRVLVLILFIATSAFAQEYGRASAGTIDLVPKSGNRFDGSLSLFSGGSFGATTGGTLMKDRVWFFASADRQQPLVRATTLPTSTTDLSAVLAKTRPVVTPLTLPSNFLSLHSTTLFSPNSSMTIDVHSTR